MSIANDIEVEEVNDSKTTKEKRSAKHDSGAADLERVTNYTEEMEIKSDVNFISLINDAKRQENNNKLAIERELAKVTIKKEDVELIVQELEIPKGKAERALKEHKGNLIDTLVFLTN